MEYNLEKQANPKTLFNDFGQWSRLEEYFTKQLSQKDLQSRRFRNMKLRQYNQMIRLYSGAGLTQDEQALMTVMKFQRGSLVRSLYPGLLSRIVYLVSKGVDNLLFYNKEMERVKMATDQRIINTKISIPQNLQEGSLKPPSSQSTAEEQANSLNQKRYGADLGSRSQSEQQRNHGPSM
ncbi:hypothetical protein [Sphingobacterium thalpophilum]|uniref:hypothetical protein n=1 Tax=Sphingobacterium thalpophilum TaxID=259 RepID=UPI003D97007C